MTSGPGVLLSTPIPQQDLEAFHMFLMYTNTVMFHHSVSYTLNNPHYTINITQTIHKIFAFPNGKTQRKPFLQHIPSILDFIYSGHVYNIKKGQHLSKLVHCDSNSLGDFHNIK